MGVTWGGDIDMDERDEREMMREIGERWYRELRQAVER